MEIYLDFQDRKIRFTDERKKHIEEFHPELKEQFIQIKETLKNPEIVVESKSDESIEMFYRFYTSSPVGEKFLCVVVKVIENDNFIVTVYFTDKIKKGKVLWEKK